MPTQFWTRMVYPMLLFSLSACKFREPSLSESQGNVVEGSAYLWDRREIAVCWQDFSDRFASQRQKIQDLVTREFSQAGFQFTGWKACRAGDQGIWIQETSDAELASNGILGEVKAFGKKLDGMPGGIRLFFNYQIAPFQSILAPGSCSGEHCLLTTALHEFGHALGLRHEADRIDSTCDETQMGGVSDEILGGIRIGSFDKDSIMNYCANTRNDLLVQPSRLSSGDIATLRFVYEKRSIFPREQACRADGHRWQTENLSACCTQQTEGQVRSLDARPYRFCTELPTIITYRPVIVDQWLIARLGPLPFAKPGIGVLRCREDDGLVNFFSYQDTPSPAYRHSVSILLKHPMKNQLGSYNCSSLTIYDSASILNARQAVRYSFTPETKFPIKRGSAYWDLTKAPFKSLKVKNAVIEGDAAPLTVRKENAQEPSAHQGLLRLTVANLNPGVNVLEGKLSCDPYQLAVTGQSMHADSGTLGLNIPLDTSVVGKAKSLICSALELSLQDRSQQPPVQSQTVCKFSQPQILQVDGRNYTMDLPANSCVSEVR